MRSISSRTRVVGGLRTAAFTVLLAVGLVTTLMTPMPADASTQMTATEGVNIRSEPSTSASIVGGLYRGQTVTALSSSKGWTAISFGHGKAYVASRYLTEGGDLPAPAKIDAGTVKVTTSDLNLRQGPGLSYDVISVLTEGSRVTMTGKTAQGWAELVHGTSTGWASTQYLASAADGLPAIIGTRVATAALDIRTTSGADAKTVAEVKKGTKLSVTGATQNGRAQIVYKKAIRWVTAKYLANPDTTLPSVPGLPSVTGTRYATTALDIRSTYADSYTKIAEVPKGTALSITGVVKNGRMQVIYNSAARWVTSKYLSSTRPSVGSPGAYAVEKGLKPNAVKVHRAIMAEFPEIKTFYGVRRDALPDHPSGRALDVMLPNYKSAAGKALGQRIATWARAHHTELGINYIIWNQHIWNVQRDREGWRYMASRGSDTANHKNHVHITVIAAGYSLI